MQLQRVQTEDFRAYKAAELVLPPQGIALVVGANNTGKSALLSALDIITSDPFEEYGSSQDDRVSELLRYAGSPNPARIRAAFRLTPAEGDHFLFALSPRLAGDLPISARPDILEWEFEEAPEKRMFPIALNAQWTSVGQATYELVRITGSGRPTWQYRLGGGSGREISWGEPVPVPFRHIEEERDAFRIAEGYWEDWRSHYYHLEPLRSGARRSQQLTADERLEPDGRNLPGVVLFLQTHRPEVWNHVNDILSQIVPDLGKLGARPIGTRNKIVAVDPNFESHEPNLKDLGTGVEQLLMTIIVALTQPAPSLVVIEEPETGLHPFAQRELLRLLREEWTTDRLFLISTHSPVFLDRAPGAAQLFLVKRSAGISTVDALEKQSTSALAALGVRLSDVLSADRILLVEGPSDRAILEEWFPDVVNDPGVEIIEAGGGDYSRYVDTLAKWLEAIDRLGPQRRILFLRDRDELPVQMLQRMQRSPNIYTVERRELENYLLDPRAIADVLQHRYAIEVEPIELAAEIRVAADSLKSAIVLKRVARQLEPVGWVSNRMRGRLAKRPSLKSLQESVLSDYPEPSNLRVRIADLWKEEERDLKSNWNEQWAALAPGAQVLDKLWKKLARRSYDKLQDGPKIAAAMARPDELCGKLQSFMERPTM